MATTKKKVAPVKQPPLELFELINAINRLSASINLGINHYQLKRLMNNVRLELLKINES